LSPERKPDLKERVLNAAEAALADHQYVSPIDILTGIRLLHEVNVERWKKGRIDSLDEMIQGNPKKISDALTLFRDWAVAKGLKPSETRYVRNSPAGTVNLKFSVTADPNTERFFRTHYLSPALPERKQKQITEKASRPEPPVVFDILRESECSECGAELPKGSFLLMEKGQPLCLPCARLGDLEYLPSGDTALTRRSTKYSSRSAVVVRFSRSRGHYERQGILVEPAAIEKAEQECSEDAEERAKARAAGAVRRQEEDRALIAEMTRQIAILFPRCPPKEAAAIAAHTAKRGSGRVGRSAAGRKLQEQALTLAVAAAVRHNHTKYDELLASGADRGLARQAVADRVAEMLENWRAR